MGTIEKELEIILIAKACHVMNSQFCSIIGDKVLDWDELSVGLKASIMTGVEAAIEGNSTPEQSHQSWLDCRTNLGWTYGERDDEKKTHPCMVPYDKLPERQKAKDKIFLAVVDALK